MAHSRSSVFIEWIYAVSPQTPLQIPKGRFGEGQEAINLNLLHRPILSTRGFGLWWYYVDILWIHHILSKGTNIVYFCILSKSYNPFTWAIPLSALSFGLGYSLGWGWSKMIKDGLFGFWLRGGKGAPRFGSPEFGFILTSAASTMLPKLKNPNRTRSKSHTWGALMRKSVLCLPLPPRLASWVFLQ